MNTIADALRSSRDQLASSSDSADLDARLLIQHVLRVDAAYLIVHHRDILDRQAQCVLAALVARRAAGEPIAYLTGGTGFWTLDLVVNPHVLIPRPDTETLVEAALQRLTTDALKVADLGTGSGAIALSLASERPTWQMWASDASADALACARANAQRLNITNVSFRQGAWLAALPAHESFDAIVSNPPYIARHDAHLASPALTYEPEIALVADDDGMADLSDIVRNAPARLCPGGWIMLEHGAEQGPAVRDLMHRAALHRIETVTDLGDRQRITVGQKA